MPKATILLVDDTQINVRYLQDVLTRYEYDVRPCVNGTEALRALEEAPVDLVLLDIMMPDLSGYEVCERLKADKKTRNIPVIFLSALTQELDKVKAFSVGGVDFISKPFQVKEVLARVETHLALSSLRKQLEEKNTALQREIVERKRVDENFRRSADRLRILHELDQSIVAARSPETIGVVAVGRIRQLIPCQRVVVIARTSEGILKTLTAEASANFPLEIDVDLYGEVFENASLLAGRVHGIQDLSRLTERSPLQQRLFDDGMLAYVVIPLLVHDELVGILHLEAVTAGIFDASHIDIAIEVASLLAVAMRQARLYELAQQEIAERILAEEALRQQTAELEERNAELDAFAHTVAHDLKAPLSALVGFSDLLQKRYGQIEPAKFIDMLDIIAQSSRRMSNIIDELLLLASVRKMEDVPISALDTAEIVMEAQIRLSSLISEYDAEIVVPESWPEAYGYGPWVVEVWVNYISNAVKYGGKPPRLELGAGVTAPGQVQFWVKDNGPGLTEEDQSRLFTAFDRLQQASVEGHGLGLSIVQRIVERLDGKVGVRSQVGKGSRFYFALPGPLTDGTPVNWNWASPEALKELRGEN